MRSRACRTGLRASVPESSSHWFRSSWAWSCWAAWAAVGFFSSCASFDALSVCVRCQQYKRSRRVKVSRDACASGPNRQLAAVGSSASSRRQSCLRTLSCLRFSRRARRVSLLVRPARALFPVAGDWLCTIVRRGYLPGSRRTTLLDSRLGELVTVPDEPVVCHTKGRIRSLAAAHRKSRTAQTAGRAAFSSEFSCCDHSAFPDVATAWTRTLVM